MLKKFHEAALDEIYVPGSNEEVFSGRLLKVQRDHVTLPNGNDTTREYIRHPGAVAIVPVLADGSVDEDEFIGVQAFTPAELRRMVADGELYDAKTLCALYAAKVI